MTRTLSSFFPSCILFKILKKRSTIKYKSSAHFLCALTVLPVDLILGDDDLARVDVANAGDGVTQDADDSDHLTHFGDTIHSIAGVANQLLAPGDLWRANT